MGWLASEGITKASQLQPEHIRKFIIRRQKEGLSPYTVHGFARVIKTLSFMVREGIVSKSPMAVVQMPKLPNDPLPPFTAKDVQALLHTCANDRDKALVLTLLDSGVRASECCELNVSDLDMKTGALTVRLGKGRKSP